MSPIKLLRNAKKAFTCHKCNLPCESAESLKEHIAKKHMWSPITCFLCNICQDIYKEQDEVIQHIMQLHYQSVSAVPREYQENVDNNNKNLSGKTAPTAPSAVPDTALSPPTVPLQALQSPEFQCQHCPESFTEESGLQEHVKRAHLTERCSHCPEAFSSQTGLELHLTKKHKGVQKELRCPMGPMFLCSTQESRQKHITENHLGKSMFQDQGVKAEPHLDPDMPEKCQHCDKGFMHPQSLQSHLKTAHSATQCPFCMIVVKDSSSLREHIQLKHQAEQKPTVTLKCPLCTQRHNSKEALKQHMTLAHPAPGVKRQTEYKCSRCNDASYPSKHMLNVHLWLSHPGEDAEASSSQCPICGLTMPEMEMKEHNRICHPLDEGTADSSSVSSLSGSFECDLCDRVCRSQENLDRHMQRRH